MGFDRRQSGESCLLLWDAHSSGSRVEQSAHSSVATDDAAPPPRAVSTRGGAAAGPSAESLIRASSEPGTASGHPYAAQTYAGLSDADGVTDGYSTQHGGSSTASQFMMTQPGALSTRRVLDMASTGVETVTEARAVASATDTVLAIAWWPDQPFSLLAGVGAKSLRGFDTRVGQGAGSAVLGTLATAKSIVTGIQFDPFSSHRFLTYSDEPGVKIWDARRLEQAVFTVSTDKKAVAHAMWSPQRAGVIGGCCADDSNLYVWDLPNMRSDDWTAGFKGKDTVIVPSTRKRQAHGTLNVVSLQSSPTVLEANHSRTLLHGIDALARFSWHPSIKDRLLSITQQGVVEDHMLHDNLPICLYVSFVLRLCCPRETSTHVYPDLMRSVPTTTPSLRAPDGRLSFAAGDTAFMDVMSDLTGAQWPLLHARFTTWIRLSRGCICDSRRCKPSLRRCCSPCKR